MKLRRLLLVAALVSLFAMGVSAQKATVEEVIAKHLESIGLPADRAVVKNQMAVGEVLVKFVSQKNQTAQGRIVIVSEANKSFFGMNLTAADYPSDKFGFDGQNARVGYVRTNVRSPFGNFLQSNQVMLRDGLLGGTLSTSWAIANLLANKAKASMSGSKKIDGKDTYVVSYSSKGGSDLDISMYFEKATHRHLRTEYKRTWSAAMGRTIDESARQNESRLKITENFSDFKTVKGLTLPHAYTINYSITGQNGTTEIEWVMTFTEFSFNQNLAAETFNITAN